MVPVPYSFYVLFVGFSEVHHISMKRVVLALVGIPTALFLLRAAPYKTSPLVDGYYTPEDGWGETQPVKFTSGGTHQVKRCAGTPNCSRAAGYDD